MAPSLLSRDRSKFHRELLSTILTNDSKGVPSNADKDSKISVALAKAIVDQIGGVRTAKKMAGQRSGSQFEEICARYIEQSFGRFLHLRPGKFRITKGGNISRFDQYAHLDDLEKIAKSQREIATALGSDYLIKPDIVISRYPESDGKINNSKNLLDTNVARLTSIRKQNQSLEILHASISCKWTLRSDRAQNARSEGLNLVRNRKGSLPHISVITGEPLPSRIASLALGTGDIDCVYHFALNELRSSIIALEHEDALDMLDTMINGKRLRDISDLPLDLIV